MKRFLPGKKEPGPAPRRDDRKKGGSSGLLDQPMLFIVVGLVLILSMAGMLFIGSAGEQDTEKALEQGKRAVSLVLDEVSGFTRLLDDEQVLDLASIAIDNPGQTAELEQYLAGRTSDFVSLKLYDPDLFLMQQNQSEENAFIVMAMLMEAKRSGRATIQSFEQDGQRIVAGAVTIPGDEGPKGILLLTARIDMVLSGFNMTIPEAGYIGLEQRNGRYPPTRLKDFGDPAQLGPSPYRLNVPGTLFRVVLPQGQKASGFPSWLRLVIFLLGGLLLAFGLIRRQLLARPVKDLEEDPAMLQAVSPEPFDAAESPQRTGAISEPGPEAHSEPGPAEEPHPESEPEPESSEVKAPLFNLEDVHFDPFENRREQRAEPEQAVELREDIFRAYDIRGVVGETLDHGIARSVGQAIGSTALAENAGPVVVGRDGRHSGPRLAEGMIEGIASTGCDVIDIGAVPTGVLYFMANECGSGSGVMVTGSHNPPDYNGFKVMIAGATLAGERIKALYQRLESGDIAQGEGQVQQEAALDRYRERIASDIQLQRPLKVVADCGNGIGGVCAADILRAIGAEVLPLYDEVDGDFPNHHPDPSEPENLRDLIESVSLMRADLGVAFDGDADRLGVVVPSGDIIFADRIMMLFAREILSRHPGAPIIYDVKCTGHLDRVIREAGGEPEMYKTGHSLIKNHMKEAGAPFAGEMSGHFFFGDRWYGFDCGIYSAARLLEILAMDERSPEEVLSSLPNSISTPELKVHMSEGENHAFIREFQEKASFPDAKVNTIDGVRADFEDGWGLCRASNTTPILVVRFDAESEEALQIIQEAFRMQMLAIKPDLELPF